MTEIYGIAGLKGHGKDTLAKLIVKYNPSFKILHFGDAVKELTAKIFNVPFDKCFSFEDKEKLFDIPVNMDDYLDEMSFRTGLDILPRGMIGHSIRELLQYFGTEYVRSIKNDYWVSYIKDKILDSYNKRILIPDVRFPNEVNMIKSLDGNIIKVIRLNKLTDQSNSGSNHASENINIIKEDLLLSFIDDKTFALQNIIAELIANGNYGTAQVFHFTFLSDMIKYYNRIF